MSHPLIMRLIVQQVYCDYIIISSYIGGKVAPELGGNRSVILRSYRCSVLRGEVGVEVGLPAFAGLGTWERCDDEGEERRRAASAGGCEGEGAGGGEGAQLDKHESECGKRPIGRGVPNAVSAGGVRWGEGGGASVKATPAVAAARSANSLRIRPATEPWIVETPSCR